jgi:hypothetical protein
MRRARPGDNQREADGNRQSFKKCWLRLTIMEAREKAFL